MPEAPEAVQGSAQADQLSSPALWPSFVLQSAVPLNSPEYHSKATHMTRSEILEIGADKR